jgi:hypothetical protein
MSLRTIPQDGVAIRFPLENRTIGGRIATSLALLAMTAVELAGIWLENPQNLVKTVKLS